MRIPIACNLEHRDALSQLGEWRELGRVVDRVARVSPHRLELRLLPDADVASITDLAQREKACCPFFAFTVEISAEYLVFVVEVPGDAIDVLDQLAPLATKTTGSWAATTDSPAP